jgi:imidazolonepropionase-like amidohydrolase
LALAAAPAAHAQVVVLDGADLLPVSGDRIPGGRVVMRDGKLAAVGRADAVRIPAGAEVRDHRGHVIVPGLVDTHSHLGLYPRPNVPAHSDGNETSGPVQSGVRALDAIWPGDPGIRMALAGGITTANIMPGSGNVVGGQTAYVKLHGRTVQEMLIPGSVGGLKLANGENPKRVYGGRKQAPQTRMKVAALQRDLFVRAQQYREKGGDEDGKRDLDLEPVIEVLEGTRTVHYHTHRADDILTALRLRDEFGFDLVLQHVSEGALVAQEIARRGVPCSIIVLDSPGGKHEAARLGIETGGVLERAGVPVAIHSDDPVTPSRLFLRSAALAVRGGMSEDAALRAVTLEAARMLRLDERLGSLEPGKDADLVVLSGEPFSVWTKVLETWIEGERVFDRSDPRQRGWATGGFLAVGNP